MPSPTTQDAGFFLKRKKLFSNLLLRLPHKGGHLRKHVSRLTFVIRHYFHASFLSIFDPTSLLSLSLSLFFSYFYPFMLITLTTKQQGHNSIDTGTLVYLLLTSAVRPPHNHLATLYLKQSTSNSATQSCAGTSSMTCSLSH